MGIWDIVSAMAGIVLIVLLGMIIYAFLAALVSTFFKGKEKGYRATIDQEAEWDKYLAKYRKEWSAEEKRN